MFKKREILLPERLMGMMRLLILNVTDHRIQLRMCIRERSKTGLPFCLSLWYCSHVAPLGLWDICCVVCSINMSPLWG